MMDKHQATWLDLLFAVVCITAVVFCCWKAVTSDCKVVPSKGQNMP